MFMGREIANFVRGRKNNSPDTQSIRNYALKNGHDPLMFSCAVIDFCNGKWMSSEMRSASCDLGAEDCFWNRTTGEVGKGARRPRGRKRNVAPSKSAEGVVKRVSRQNIVNGENFTLAEIMTEQNCRCYACGVDLIVTGSYELDHINPISLGGSNEYENLQFLCQPCNRRKSASNPLIWAATKGIKLPEKFMRKYYG